MRGGKSWEVEGTDLHRVEAGSVKWRGVVDIERIEYGLRGLLDALFGRPLRQVVNREEVRLHLQQTQRSYRQ